MALGGIRAWAGEDGDVERCIKWKYLDLIGCLVSFKAYTWAGYMM